MNRPTVHIQSVDEEFVQFHTDRFNELPDAIKQKGIEFLRKLIGETDEENQNLLRKMIAEKPDFWATPWHFTWGMYIRNQLREHVALDNELPSNNWDDYYVRLVEAAVK